MTMVRVIAAVAAFVILLLNIGPLITAGEMNSGMLFGFAAAGCLAGYAAFFHKINSFIARLWSGAAGKAVLCIAAAVLLTGGAVFCVTFAKVVAGGAESGRETRYVIVLGCRVEGTKPGIFLNGRINKAYGYLTAHPESKAILSGGQGPDEGISEGRCMYNELVGKGIAPERLTVEDASTSTNENFANSIAKLRDSGVEIDEITVVTNDFHEYRARLTALANGLDAYSYPMRTPWNGYVPFAVREVFAVIYIKLFGRG